MGWCCHQGAHALLPALHASSEKAEGSHLADDTYDKAEDSSHCEKIQTSVVREDGGVSSIGGVDGAEEWETADERIQASLSGGVSLTSLDVSSPIVTSRFVKRYGMALLAACFPCRWLFAHCFFLTSRAVCSSDSG